MFVVHLMQDGMPTKTRDFGHVNQFYKRYPIFRNSKDEPIFNECIEQGFMYVHLKVDMNQAKDFYTYHKRLDLMLEELVYNREKHGY